MISRFMRTAFWVTLTGAIGIFIFSLFTATDSFAPISIGGVYLESAAEILAFVLCPVFYLISSVMDKRLSFGMPLAYLSFVVFLQFIYPTAFGYWLDIFYSPDPACQWNEDHGVFYYTGKHSAGDPLYSGQALSNPPWIQAPSTPSPTP